jgi:hypothetical protein
MPEQAPTNEQFLRYYEKYYEAKDRQYLRSTWLYAVYCRAALQKLALVPHNKSRNEEDVLQEIFPLLTQEQIKPLSAELRLDSRHPPLSATV